MFKIYVGNYMHSDNKGFYSINIDNVKKNIYIKIKNEKSCENYLD